MFGVGIQEDSSDSRAEKQIRDFMADVSVLRNTLLKQRILLNSALCDRVFSEPGTQ